MSCLATLYRLPVLHRRLLSTANQRCQLLVFVVNRRLGAQTSLPPKNINLNTAYVILYKNAHVYTRRSQIMLDDLKMIHGRDAQDALGIAEKQWRQLGWQGDCSPDFHGGQINNIVYAGMGGSALAAQFLHTWPTVSVPFEIVRNYDIPAYVGERTLFIAASYSGNTEETLAALGRAEVKGAQIAVIAGGGKLVDIAREKGYSLTVLPRAEQPRFAAFYNFKALLVLLQQASLVEHAKTELVQAADLLRDSVQAWLPTVPAKSNLAKQIALECIGKSVVVYAGPKLFPRR